MKAKFSRLHSIISRYEPLIEVLLGSRMVATETGAITFKGYSLLNIFDMEVIGGETEIYSKISNLVINGLDRENLKTTYDNAMSVFAYESQIQGFINRRDIESKAHGVFVAAVDIIKSEQIPLLSDIKRGEKLILLHSSPDQICGFYHRQKKGETLSFSPAYATPIPFLFKGKKNPILYYKSNPFVRLGRNSKNIISDCHSAWIRAVIALGDTVSIRTSQQDMMFLFGMFKQYDLFLFHENILINGDSMMDSFFLNADRFALSDAFQINMILSGVANKIGGSTLTSRVRKLDNLLFGNRSSFGSGVKTDAILAKIIKEAIIDIYDLEFFKVSIDESMLFPIINKVRYNAFFHIGINNAQNEAVFIKRIEAIAMSMMREIRRNGTYDCKIGKNFSISTETETFIIGSSNAVTFSLSSRSPLVQHDIRLKGSPFLIKNTTRDVLSTIRRRGVREKDTQNRAIKHFLLLADESNAHKLLSLIKVILASLLAEFTFVASIEYSKSTTLNEEVVEVLIGSYVNDAISIVIDDRDLSSVFAEDGKVLVRNEVPHPGVPSVVMTKEVGDIQLRQRVDGVWTKKNNVLLGRTRSVYDSVELLYFVSSKLNMQFDKKADIAQRVEALGWLAFSQEYL